MHHRRRTSRSAQPFGDAPPAERLGLGRPSPCSAGIKNAGLAGLDASPTFGWCWSRLGSQPSFLSQPNRGPVRSSRRRNPPPRAAFRRRPPAPLPTGASPRRPSPRLLSPTAPSLAGPDPHRSLPSPTAPRLTTSAAPPASPPRQLPRLPDVRYPRRHYPPLLPSTAGGSAASVAATAHRPSLRLRAKVRRRRPRRLPPSTHCR
ncbi:hypothetical protein PVAP13_5KG239400 [Panicum virgatum]|uniref:Uncharacterized protein n=1 Tax=Panicum virgatum TaxID=38727 RepID=A0A8T0SGG5_PANVG|nr:hypothetical protein PVAP13_5KG239400 [Panicum virgatum]